MQQQQKGFDPSLKDSFNMAYGAMKCQALCITPIIRFGFGSEALGFPALGAFVALALWTMATEAEELQLVAVCWFFAVIFQRLCYAVNRWRGGYWHSRYDGWPILTGWMCRNETVAKMIEGSAVFCLGACLEDNPLGMFLMASGAAIVALEVTNQQYHRKVEQMRWDGMIEMQTERRM